jgi:hypothetical protein
MSILISLLKKVGLKLLSEYMMKRLIIALLKDLKKRAEKTETPFDDEVVNAAIEVLEDKEGK